MLIPIVIILIALVAWKIGRTWSGPPQFRITEYRFVERNYKNETDRWDVIHVGAETPRHLADVSMAKGVPGAPRMTEEMIDAVAAFMEEQTASAHMLACKEPTPRNKVRARYYQDCCRSPEKTMLVAIRKPPPRDPRIQDGLKCMECGLYDGEHDAICTVGAQEREA